MSAELFLRFSRPGRFFLSGDDISLSVFNPGQLDIELIAICKDADENTVRVKLSWETNPAAFKAKDLPMGPFQIVARTIAKSPMIRSNSISGAVLSDEEENCERILADRILEHRMDCAVTQSSKNVLTLYDPWILPAAAATLKCRKWFPTAVYEGSTSLYNETPHYYEDPLEYFLHSIAQLKKKGLNFITWHDILDSTDQNLHNAIVLQFDLDAGPNSFHRIAERLVNLGIRATAMVHWQARHWYTYDMSDDDAKKLRNLEAHGWAIGYHHNTLTTLIGADETRLDRSDLVIAAQNMMRKEVRSLREHVNIRTLTHHGGNVINRSIPIPSDLDIIPVDRLDKTDLWERVSDTFSDGSFTARPMPLSDWVAKQMPGTGMRFMRCHPVKYGNYDGAVDLPELTQSAADLPGLSEVINKVKSQSKLSPLERQVAWLSLRKSSRAGIPLAETRFDKPLSSQFRRTSEVMKNIARFRACRRPGFLRQYPWSDGDPRVIWWHMLANFCPQGRVLNVGAMPPDQKDETIAFVPSGSQIVELDIDPKREPDILGDFCAVGYQTTELFDAVFLNGLPYFSHPDRAIENAQAALKPGGVLLVGAAGASQPERGGLYRPNDRPIWRKGQGAQLGESLSLLSMLWSFDALSIEQLKAGWDGDYTSESMAHYWFVHATKATKDAS